MPAPLRVLIVEDLADDAELLARELRRGGYDLQFERVDSRQGMAEALGRQIWDLVASDHSMLQFDSNAALRVLKASGADIPYCHHEKWDGSGYPRGLKGEEIPLAARLFAVVDVWDAVRSERPYSAAWSSEESLEYLSSIAGTHLDPRLTAAFIELLASLDEPAPAGAHSEGDAGQATGTILVVDDYQPSVDLLCRWLTKDGYQVMTADSGESALAAVAHHHPDLVLLDIEIPAPDGFVVCQRLKRDPATSRIPVIFMSGLEPITTEMSARHLGAADYVAKPVDAYALRLRIRRVLDRVRNREE